LQGPAVLFQQATVLPVLEPVIPNAPEPIFINTQYFAAASSEQNTIAEPTA
jgi:hypothetical protein